MDDRIDISFSFGCGTSRMNAFCDGDIPHRMQFRVRSFSIRGTSCLRWS
jgi:hypothetical protein